MAKYELSSGENVVYLGDTPVKHYFHPPKNYYDFYWWAKQHFDVEGRYDNHPKTLHKVLHENFGSKIPLRFGAAMYNTFIKANIPREATFAVRQLGRHWKLFDPKRVNVAVEHNHLVQQAVRDKTLNILPLMLHHKETPQQLRSRYGKGMWKKLANTSKSRMQYLCRLIDAGPEWADVRTCILKEVATHGLWDPRSNTELTAAKIAPKSGMYRGTSDMIFDTVRMSGGQVNYDWSYKRWEEEHSRLVKEQLVKKYSDKPFSYSVEYTEDGYTFTLLNTQMQIAAEGKEMGHCVGSYANSAARDQYAVFKVEGNGERATLGLSGGTSSGGTSINILAQRTEPEFIVNQCYGRYNSGISKRLEATLLKIVKRFNDDRVRYGDRWSVGSSNQDTRPVLDQGWHHLQLDLALRRNAQAVNF